MSEFRHEWKHIINMSDCITIRQRLRAVARPDPHAPFTPLGSRRPSCVDCPLGCVCAPGS